MKTVLLATTNHRKIREASETLAPYGLGVESVSVDINEIQHHDSAEIAKAKARAAYQVVKEPVVIQDTSWEIPALGGFPGGYMKDIAGWWVPEDWTAVMSRHEDRTIFCVEHVVYFDGNETTHFQSRYTGIFVEEPRGNDGDSLDKSVSIHGGKTIAEMHDLGELATKESDLQHWAQFAEWYKEQK
jgi:non-canonical purine NTP pyrophosphatase (RdgB/HAM1 family)